MACEFLGYPLDIHFGGIDLKYPHHENEIAQTEARSCNGIANPDIQQQCINYFVHTGHMHIEGLKMSKSLKNFITIYKMLEEISPRQIRLLFLLHQYDALMIYHPENSIPEALNKDRKYRDFFLVISSQLRQSRQPQMHQF